MFEYNPRRPSDKSTETPVAIIQSRRLIAHGRQRGAGIVELVLILASIVIIFWGLNSWHESIVRNYPGPRCALRHPARDIPSICAIAIRPDQQTAISVGTEGILRMYDLKNRTCSSEVVSANPESSVLTISPDGNRFVVGTHAGHIELWVRDAIGAPAKSRLAHDGRITCLTFHPDGQTFLSCGTDQRNIVWNATNLEPVFELPAVSSPIHSAHFLATGKLLVTGNQNAQLQLWDMATKVILNTTVVIHSSMRNETIIKGIAILSDETEVLAATRGGKIGIWNLKSGRQTQKFQSPERSIASLCLLKNGRNVITGGTDGQIQIWDVQTGTCVKSIAGHAGPVLSIEATADSQLLISAGWDGATKFWDI